LQTLGNVSVGVAAVIVLVPLNTLMLQYARKYPSGYDWAMPMLYVLIPVWLLLMTALLCVTASGGFDWLPFGRTGLYALTVAAALALGMLSFGLVASYIRPGFIPNVLFYVPLLLVFGGTMLLVVTSLNPQPGIPPRMVRLPWTLLSGLSLVISVVGGGYWLATAGVSTIKLGIIRSLNAPSSTEALAKISTLDPQKDFYDLVGFTSRYAKPEIRDAAIARLRSNPDFLETFAKELEQGYGERAIEFIYSATLTPAEQARLAEPTRKVMERWVSNIPAPNYTTKQRLRELRDWGNDTFRVLPGKFTSTKVDFAPIIAEFKER
ncbi:MAG: hypothetical protein ACO1Q7_02910, partial [Gemmatimonas sp.]